MAKARQQRAARLRGKARRARKSTVNSPAAATVSLPLPDAEPPSSLPVLYTCKCGTKLTSPRLDCPICERLTPPEARVPAGVPPHAYIAEGSQIGEAGVRIYVMRAAGIPDEAIAKALNLSVKTLSGYVYKAGRNGLLDDVLHEPKERLEYAVLHKVVRNLEEGLEDDHRNEKTGLQVKTHVALKIAEGALFPRVQQQAIGGTNMLMGIKIEVVNGEPGEVREGTVLEAPAYAEGEEV